MRHPTGSKTEDNKWPAGIAQPSVVRGGQFRLWPVYLRPLVTEARRVGVDIEALFRGVPFTSAHLDQPGFTVSHIEAITVVRHSLALFNRPNLGIELGSRSRITDRGALALGIMASPDLGTAMALSLHFPSSAGFLLNLRELRPLGQHVVVAESRLDNQDVAGFLVDKLFAGMVRQRRQISESDASPVFVDLMRAPPASVSGYEQFFRCPVRFNTRSNQLGFDTLRFDAPLPMSNAMSYRLAYRLLERDAEMMAGPSALVLAVMHAVRQALPLVPTPAQIASSLHISERSLRRKLADENLSYRVLLDEVRGARALDLVQNGRRSMGEVAELTGFADPRSFRRAFNRWIGRAPSLARAESDESDQTMKQGTGDQETPG